MIRADMIPDEVVEAFRDAWTRKLNARKTIATALNAWPKGYSLSENDSASIRNVLCLILPLPQKKEERS